MNVIFLRADDIASDFMLAGVEGVQCIHGDRLVNCYLITQNRDTLILQISRCFQNREIEMSRKQKCRENLLQRKLSDVILKLNNFQLRLLRNVI